MIDESGEKLALTDSQGTQITMGWIGGCPVAVVTKASDAQFKEVYGLMKGFSGIIWAFSTSWNEAKPTSEILSFNPTTLKVVTGFSDVGAPQFKNIALNSQQSKDLMDVLDTSLWRKDPDPNQYAYGMDPIYEFEDTKGNNIRVYDSSMSDSALIYVTGPMAGSNTLLFYLTSHQTFIDLKTTVELMFPN